MIRLINDSGILEEEISSLDGITFDQMIQAIHQVQTDLDITGTTARESAGTIEGSLNSTKAAWANLLTGMADDSQDFGKLLDDFMTSAGNFITNITPRIQQIFEAIPQAIKTIAPQIPALLQAILPSLVSAAVQLVASLAAQLPSILVVLKDALFAALDAIIAAIKDKAPALAAPLEVAFNAIKTAINFVVDHFKGLGIAVGVAAAAFGAFQLLSFVGQAGSVAAAVARMTSAIAAGTVAKIADKTETLALNALYAKDAALKAASTVKTIALAAAQKAAAAAQWLVNAAMNANPIGILVIAIVALVAAFVLLWNKSEGFRNFFIGMWEAIKSAFGNVVDWISEKLKALGEFFTEAWQGIKDAVDMAVNGIKTVITNVFNAIKTFISTAVEGWKIIITTVWNAIKTAVETVVNAVKTVITTIFNAIKTFIQLEINGWKLIITTVWNAIKTAVTTVVNAIKTVITTVFNAIKTFITTVVNGWKTIITTVWNGIKTGVTTAVNAVKSTVTNVFNSIKSTVTTIWNGIKNAITTPIEAAKNAVKNIIEKIKGFFNFTVSLPHIKLPHFKINPSGWKIGDLLQGEIPSLGIEWYAKGGIFDKPTIMPSVRGLMGVGEAGAEAVTPIDALLGYVRTAVAEQNAGLADHMQSIYALLEQYLPELGTMQMVTDTGALVGELAPKMNRQLGRIYKNQERGRG